MPTRLYFGEDHTLTVEEDVSAVESAFRTVAPNPAPLAEFTKQHRKVFVNVALVRYFREIKQRSGRAASG